MLRVKAVIRSAATVLGGLAFLACGPGLTHKALAQSNFALESAQICETPGTWIDPDGRRPLQTSDIMRRFSDREFVLLGENHAALEHHRWQLQSLAGLKAHADRLVIGFEMFPRAVQAVLDRWSQGELSEKEFLSQSRWRDVWGYDAAAYLPLFHFARQNRIPMRALNVERGLVSRVGREGWEAVPLEEREGVTDPVAAEEGYLNYLAGVYRNKILQGHGLQEAQGGGEIPEVSDILERDDFKRFVDAQLTWDRAMADALFQAKSDYPDALVVGVIGRGHLEHGYGVPHQLSDLGATSIAILLPVEIGGDCRAMDADIADAVFLVDREESAEADIRKPRLGVMVEPVEGGVRVLKVTSGSVAEATGLIEGDVIYRAADLPVSRASDLIEIIQRQAPGTWLPLGIKRNSEELLVLAKFPPR
ncbi:MAG: ChaN family lipoprotein [Kiloniellales bacterium]|nr:ChaN family lipoprotein [Kiloniellales bacterium]